LDNDKSILEKFTDTVKGLAETATNAASQALKAEEPPVKDEDLAAMYMPLAADGFVSDPLLVPPIAAMPPRRKTRAAPKRSAAKARKVAKKASKKSAKKAAKKTAKKTTRKAAKKSTARKTKKTAKKVAKKTAKRITRKPAKKSRKASRRKR
jgi:hypothetical protein